MSSKRIRYVLALMLVPCLTMLCLCSCVKKAGETVRVTLSEVTHSVFYAPQYAALQLGYFTEEGLEIELSTGQGADAVAAAVLSGQVDIGFAGPEATIYVYNEGRDNYLKVFAQMTRRDGSFLLSRKKNDNFQWSDLRGAHILPGRKGGVPYMTFEYLLRQNGLDPQKDLLLDNSVQYAMMTGAFVAGTGDYVTAFEPTASMLQAEGKGYIVASIGQASGEIPYTAYFASRNYIKQNPKVIQGFANAIARGQKWCAEHSAAEIARLIAPDFPDTDLSLLTSAVQSYLSIDAFCKTPVMEKASFERLQDVISSAGELKNRAPFAELVDNSFAEKAAR